MNRFFWITVFLSLGVAFHAYGQFMRETYHDKERKNIKEVYQVQDTIKNILDGPYISYYLNGKVESKGQFANNETTGIWEFFYETGGLKMRGILKQSANYGLWEYFYENGKKSMEGTINGRNREGEWKSYYENGQLKDVGSYVKNKRSGLWRYYYEDGSLKGETDFKEDIGRHTEYYHSGKIASKGPKNGTRNVGHWRFFNEDGTLQSEGEFANGKKEGEWKFYHSNGNVASKGSYLNDEPSGLWEYYFEDGKLSSSGSYVNGKKSSQWKTMNKDGSLKSEISYNNGRGDYREYYASGKLKATGVMVNDHRDGSWKFYFEDGKLEGETEYIDGKGTYHGYYPNGALQTKGAMEDERKVGTWEIYETDGKLSGYYRPFYDDKKVGEEITELAGKSSINKVVTRGKHFGYFDERVNEFKGVILGGNPVFMFAGKFPLSVEFYLQERLGHEFEFVGIRDPFFKADNEITPGKLFVRGYSICIKQKFYNPVKVGMWYFGHEIRFSNLGHFTNVILIQNPDNVFTASSTEQRIEYGVLLGYRLMQRNNIAGLTIDAFASIDVGYRGFDVDYYYTSYFENLNQSKFSHSFHFGLNLGNVFPFR